MHRGNHCVSCTGNHARLTGDITIQWGVAPWGALSPLPRTRVRAPLNDTVPYLPSHPRQACDWFALQYSSHRSRVLGEFWLGPTLSTSSTSGGPTAPQTYHQSTTTVLMLSNKCFHLIFFYIYIFLMCTRIKRCRDNLDPHIPLKSVHLWPLTANHSKIKPNQNRCCSLDACSVPVFVSILFLFCFQCSLYCSFPIRWIV